MLDGAIMVNERGVNSSSLAGSTLGVDGIREYRVITNSFSAEYGMTMGSQVALVSKGGTNQLHGDVFEYLRNSALDARNFFDLKSASSPGRLPPYKRNQFGGSAGGPIKKDKTFVYGVYEALRQRLGLSTLSNVISAGCHGTAGAVITSTACPQLGNVPAVTIAPQIAPLLALIPLPNLPNNQFTYPFTVALNANRSRSRVNSSGTNIDRPDLVVGRNNSNITSSTTAGCLGVAPGQKLGTPNLYYDPCAFTIPAAGFLGTAGRNILRGPGLANLDFSLVKDTAIKRL